MERERHFHRSFLTKRSPVSALTRHISPSHLCRTTRLAGHTRKGRTRSCTCRKKECTEQWERKLSTTCSTGCRPRASPTGTQVRGRGREAAPILFDLTEKRREDDVF